MMGGSIKIGNRNYTWAELSKPEVRRAILPQVEQMIARTNGIPNHFSAQGWSDLDVQTAILWTTRHVRRPARRNDARLHG